VNVFSVFSSDGDFAVDNAAIGIWNLQGVLGSQKLIIDLLLTITPSSPVSSFGLILPFDLSEDGKDFEDQVEFLDTAKSATIPFWFKSTIGASATPISTSISDIVVSDRSRVAPPFARKSSVWSKANINLASAQQAGRSFSVFLRFYTGTQSSFVLWKRSFLGINGMLLDLKFGDRRQIQAVQPESAMIAAIVRAYLQPHFTSPSPVEASIVENGTWTEFLGREADLRGEAALVCYWNESSEPSDQRLYLDLSREFGLLPFGNFIRMFWVALAAWLVAYSIASHSWRGWGPAVVNWIHDSTVAAWDWAFESVSVSTAFGVKITGIAAFILIVVAIARRRKKAGTIGFLRPTQLSYARWERNRLANREAKQRTRSRRRRHST
jgi:hypothetical protein